MREVDDESEKQYVGTIEQRFLTFFRPRSYINVTKSFDDPIVI